MAKKKEQTTYPPCDDCKYAIWHTQHEWNYTVADHKPLTFHCKHNPTTRVRGAFGCKYYQSLI